MTFVTYMHCNIVATKNKTSESNQGGSGNMEWSSDDDLPLKKLVHVSPCESMHENVAFQLDTPDNTEQDPTGIYYVINLLNSVKVYYSN